jgi:hypothetical protein
VVVAGARRAGVDLLAELDPAFERSVLDLDREVTGTVDLGAFALAGDEQRPVRRDDLDGLRLHSGQLHDDVKRRRVLGAEAVALRPEAVPQAGESRHLPEVGEELLDLPLKVVDRSLAAGHVFTPTR